MVAGLVLVVGLIFIAHFLTSAMARVLESDIRSVLHQVATKEIESIRGLPYDQVGTLTGHPPGILAEEEERQVEGFTALIRREITYFTDPSYSGPYPANYRRVTIRVSAQGHERLGPVELSTNVAGGAAGGTLDITVTDARGEPVSGALITVRNNHLVPFVNLQSSALQTNSEGRLVIPGLTPDDTANYVVSATKPGYSGAATDPAVVVQDGVATVVALTIDRLASMKILVKDTEGEPVEGVNLSVVGPGGFEHDCQSVAEGVYLPNLAFSTDLDPYIVRLLAGQGYDSQDEEVVLEAGGHRDVVFIVPAGGPTTTTTAPATTTTTLAPTTTTTAGGLQGSLTVHVVTRVLWWDAGVSNARVRVEGMDWVYTNSSGYAHFSSLPDGEYTLEVQKSGYEDHRSQISINGSTSIEVRVERD